MTDFLTVVHEVKDFGAWKPIYDADAGNRAAAGLTDLMVVRGGANPNNVALMFGVSDRAKAQAMMQSPKLRETMEGAGVIGPPTARFRQGAFTKKDSANYLTINCTVSSFDTFKNGFAMDAADRKNASLTDLGVLQAVENPNDLLLVWAVGDVARATAFLNSPDLAAHQVKNAGLVGKPDAHFWKAG
jgi:hypothetical protein